MTPVFIALVAAVVASLLTWIFAYRHVVALLGIRIRRGGMTQHDLDLLIAVVQKIVWRDEETTP